MVVVVMWLGGAHSKEIIRERIRPRHGCNRRGGVIAVRTEEKGNLHAAGMVTNAGCLKTTFSTSNCS